MTSYQTEFHLTREYLAESYDESLPHGGSAKPNFMFPGVLLLAGAGLIIFTDQPEYTAFALVALGILELIHIRFRRSWWLFRQTWGKPNNIPVVLTIDDEEICTHSSLAETRVAWSNIHEIIETEKGIILIVAGGAKQYLSKSILPTEWLAKILSHHSQSTDHQF